MSELFDVLENETQTTNGMPAYVSTKNANLDLFFVIGTARGQDVWSTFERAYLEDAALATRILLWSRDIRGGAGERQRFRDIVTKMAESNDANFHKFMVAIINKIPELGRWDDLFALVGTKFEEQAMSLFANGIKSGNGLAGKWAPRKGQFAVILRNALGLSPKGYRKTIVALTKVVEQQMCAKKWNEIEYSHVPSIASKNYARAFRRHDEERYQEYLNSVINGEKKMNANAIFPHQIVQPFLAWSSNGGDEQQAAAQWKNLPNYLEGVNERILPVCDVSGSMTGMPMNVSVGLGLYFSERLEGVFKNCVVTFSSKPSFVKLKKTKLIERIAELSHIEWGMSTDIEAMFKRLLDVAVENKVAPDQMPTKLLIISDMQFDHCCKNTSEKMFTMVKRMYEESGYEMPQLVFWNVSNDDNKNVPIKHDERGVALVSGASPAVIESVLGADIDPMSVMLKTVMKDRYSVVEN